MGGGRTPLWSILEGLRAHALVVHSGGGGCPRPLRVMLAGLGAHALTGHAEVRRVG